MKDSNTFNSMPTYGQIEKIKELHQNQPPKQMSEEKQKAEALVETYFNQHPINQKTDETN